MAISKIIINDSTIIDLTQDSISSNSLLSGYVAVGSDGNTVTGSISNNSPTDITTVSSSVVVPSGYYSETTKTVSYGYVGVQSATIEVHPSISVGFNGAIAATTHASSTVFPAMSQGYIYSGVSGALSIFGESSVQLETLSSMTYTPSYSDKIISSGKYTIGDITILGDTNLVSANIADGINIFGVTGTQISKYISVNPIIITTNGTHYATYGEAYSPVTVSVGGANRESEIVTRQISDIYENTYENSEISILGSGAFMGFSSLTAVSLPLCSSVSMVAFQSCYNLVSVYLPICTHIGSSAFNSCIAISSIDLPACTSIGYSAFAGCTALTSVSIPEVPVIGSFNFNKCYALESVFMPKCQSISGYAFAECSALTSIDAPVCTFIGSSAFRNCTSLSCISIQTNVSFGSYAFQGCTALETIYLPETSGSILATAFPSCWNIKNIYAPKATNMNLYNVTKKIETVCCGVSIVIGYLSQPYLRTAIFSMCTSISGAFNDCYQLSEISFPQCTSIYSGFSNCSQLSEISFPQCTSISGSAFRGCTSLTYISLPVCTSVNVAAFDGCPLVSVYAPMLIGGPPINRPATLESLTYGARSLNASFFSGYSKLKYISCSLCSIIGKDAFAFCEELTSAYFASCILVYQSAFAGLRKLETISLPICELISARAFTDCGLTSLDLPMCSGIAEAAFAGCSSLINVNLPLCSAVNSCVFQDCINLTHISLPTCNIIRNSGFYRCSALQSIELPACVSIYSEAFWQCESLSEISLANCSYIASGAFNYCHSLERVYLYGSSVVPYRDFFYETPIMNTTYTGRFGSIIVPSSLYDTYINATGWKSIKSRIVSFI